jgi:hypothetical protein
MQGTDMNRKRWIAAIAGGMALVATGCRSTCSGTANRNNDRDDRFCAAVGRSDGRLAVNPGCDPVISGFGQPGPMFADGPVVGSMPGMGTPVPPRPDNELPFPQTIPNPGVPVTPPYAGSSRNAFEAHLPR